jgi:hypothetical protein
MLKWKKGEEKEERIRLLLSKAKKGLFNVYFREYLILVFSCKL